MPTQSNSTTLHRFVMNQKRRNCGFFLDSTLRPWNYDICFIFQGASWIPVPKSSQSACERQRPLKVLTGLVLVVIGMTPNLTHFCFKLGDKLYVTNNRKQESPLVGNLKRRTARGITYPRVTCPGGEGTPSWLAGGRGYPMLSWLGRVLHPDLAGGYPILYWPGQLPHPDLVGEYLICPGRGGYPILTWLVGIPSCPRLKVVQILLLSIPVSDPEFPRQRVGHQPIIEPKFSKNCTKIKDPTLRGRSSLASLLDPPNVYLHRLICLEQWFNCSHGCPSGENGVLPKAELSFKSVNSEKSLKQ